MGFRVCVCDDELGRIFKGNGCGFVRDEEECDLRRAISSS